MRPGRTNIPGNGHPVTWTEQTCISHPQAEGSGRHILVDNGSLRTCIHGTGAPDVEKRLVLAVRVRHPRSHDLGHSFFRSFRTGIIVPVVRSQRLLRPADVSASVAFTFYDNAVSGNHYRPADTESPFFQKQGSPESAAVERSPGNGVDRPLYPFRIVAITGRRFQDNLHRNIRDGGPASGIPCGGIIDDHIAPVVRDILQTAVHEPYRRIGIVRRTSRKVAVHGRKEI